MDKGLEIINDESLIVVNCGFLPGILGGLLVYLFIESINNPEDVKSGFAAGLAS
jgi:hypothetical protein